MLPSDIFKSFQHAPLGLLEKFNALKVPGTTSMQAVGDGYDLLLYDVIGLGGIEADDIAQALALAGGKPLNVRISSPGGDAFTGWALYNLISSYDGTVTTIVDGIAASAGAYVAMAGDTILMQPESFMMIHCGWTLSLGNRFDLATQISALSKIDESQARVFAERTDMSVGEIDEMLAAETWMSAEEAVEYGFADAIFEQSASKSDSIDDLVAAMATNFQFEKRRKQLAARLLTARN